MTAAEVQVVWRMATSRNGVKYVRVDDVTALLRAWADELRDPPPGVAPDFVRFAENCAALFDREADRIDLAAIEHATITIDRALAAVEHTLTTTEPEPAPSRRAWWRRLFPSNPAHGRARPDPEPED